jgi:hypothetical protein
VIDADEPFASDVRVILDADGRLYAHTHSVEIACEACLTSFVVRPTFDRALPPGEASYDPLAMESREVPD